MKMKQLAAMTMLAVAAGTFAHAQTSAPVKDDLFAGTEIFAKGASDVTEVTMDPDSLGMVSGKDKARAHTMVLNVVRTYEYDKPGMYNIADVEVFRNKLNSGDWHCSVHTRSTRNSESTDVCSKRRTDDMVETAIVTVQPKELTFIHTIRKRGTGEGMGPMGPMGPGEAMMIMPHISVLPQMAMLNVQPQIDIALRQLDTIDMGAMQAKILAEMQSMKALSSAELQKHVDEAMRDAEKQKHRGEQTQPE
jgi:hypothetical protein